MLLGWVLFNPKTFTSLVEHPKTLNSLVEHPKLNVQHLTISRTAQDLTLGARTQYIRAKENATKISRRGADGAREMWRTKMTARQWQCSDRRRINQNHSVGWVQDGGHTMLDSPHAPGCWDGAWAGSCWLGSNEPWTPGGNMPSGCIGVPGYAVPVWKGAKPWC
jgi:hypothetical protein